jgi:hypothetical protein
MRSAWFLAFAAALGLAACGTSWQKPGASESDYRTAKQACEIKANAQYPRKIQYVPVNKPTATTGTTNCIDSGVGTVNCQTTATTTPPQTRPIDINREAYHAAYDSCMYDKGWRPS